MVIILVIVVVVAAGDEDGGGGGWLWMMMVEVLLILSVHCCRDYYFFPHRHYCYWSSSCDVFPLIPLVLSLSYFIFPHCFHSLQDLRLKKKS